MIFNSFIFIYLPPIKRFIRPFYVGLHKTILVYLKARPLDGADQTADVSGSNSFFQLRFKEF